MIISMMNEGWDFSDLHFDPVQNITEFIRKCRSGGMDKNEILDEMVDQLHYLPTEAEIILNEFWNKTA